MKVYMYGDLILNILLHSLFSFCSCSTTGGGYAEEVVVDAGLLMPVPVGMSLETAGGLPEVRMVKNNV